MGHTTEGCPHGKAGLCMDFSWDTGRWHWQVWNCVGLAEEKQEQVPDALVLECCQNSHLQSQQQRVPFTDVLHLLCDVWESYLGHTEPVCWVCMAESWLLATGTLNSVHPM